MMAGDPWWLWTVRMLCGVGLFLAGLWFGKDQIRQLPWDPTDLESARRKVAAAGPGAVIDLTPRELAATVAWGRMSMDAHTWSMEAKEDGGGTWTARRSQDGTSR